MRFLARLWPPLAGVGLVVLTWYVVAALGVVERSQMPLPHEVLAGLVEGFTEGDLLLDVRLSVLRVLIGVVLGCALAVPVGFLLAWFETVRAMFDPLISFFRSLPPIALISLFIIYLGIGESARISLLVYAAFFSSVVVIYEGIAATDEIYVRAARSMGASQWEIFTKVVVPLAVPQALVGVRVALGVCWATVVAAELIAARAGLGRAIQTAANFFQIDEVIGAILLIGLCAVAMDKVLVVLMRRAVRWQDRVGA